MKNKSRKYILGIVFVVLWIIPIGIQSYREIKPFITNDSKKEALDNHIIRAYNPTTSDIILKHCGFICLLLIPVGIVLIIMGDRENNKKK